MNWQPTQDHYSITDYLKNEQVSDSKHEYIDGHVYAMAGASKNHQRIIGSLVRIFSEYLRNTPCDTFASDFKVKIGDLAVFYPDVIVACEPETDSEYYTEKPLIIVEVLSKSTRRVDKTSKRRLHQTLPSYRNMC